VLLGRLVTMSSHVRRPIKLTGCCQCKSGHSSPGLARIPARSQQTRRFIGLQAWLRVARPSVRSSVHSLYSTSGYLALPVAYIRSRAASQAGRKTALSGELVGNKGPSFNGNKSGRPATHSIPGSVPHDERFS